MSYIEPGPGDALLVVDVQNDFLADGQLPIADSHSVVAPINQLIGQFRAAGLPVFASRDWHPPDHCSFIGYGGPWPPHCIAGTPGAECMAGLALPTDTVIIDKAGLTAIDVYSAFSGTDLARELRARGVRRLVVCGLATDYCVLNTVLDARDEGFEVVLVPQALRAVDAQPGDGRRALDRMVARGARVARLHEHGLFTLALD